MTTTQRMLSTFDIKPTSPAAVASPDELMIDWGTLPETSTASIYVPSADAGSIAAKAASMYGSRVFAQIDAHTLRCPTRGVTYMPIPAGKENLAGLIDIDLPSAVRAGTKLTAIFTQLTRKSGSIQRRQRSDANVDRAEFALPPSKPQFYSYRVATGTFQLALELTPNAQTLRKVERNLSLLRWIYEAIPANNRWHPIFERYTSALAAQIHALGGDANAVLPSPSGVWTTGGERNGDREHFVGKIDGLIYDRFGDFEGFILETERGRTFEFFSRESHMELVARRAWWDRLRVTVTPEAADHFRARRLVLHPPE